MDRQTVDVAIVGASLAGASCALSLAQSGFSVALIDKAEFPRRKPCGEGLSLRGFRALESLGCSAALRDLPQRPFSYFDIEIRGQRRQLGSIHGNEVLGIGIARDMLDTAVLRCAMKYHQVTSYLGTLPVGIQVDSRECLVTLGDKEISSSFLVLAEGASGVWASRLGVPFKRLSTGRFGFSTPYRGQYKNAAVSILVYPDIEIYVTPVAGDQIAVACLGTKEAVVPLHRDKFQVFVRRELATFVGSEVETIGVPMMVGELASVRRASSYKRALLVGDTCESFDPIGGMGMTHAILSGISAGVSLGRVLRKELSFQDGVVDYQRARDRIAQPLRGLTRLIALSLHQRCSPQLLAILAWLGLDKAAHGYVLTSDCRSDLASGISRTVIDSVGRALDTKIAA